MLCYPRPEEKGLYLGKHLRATGRMIILLTSDRHLVGYAKLRKLDRWCAKLFHEFGQSVCWRHCVVYISDLCWIRYVTNTWASTLSAQLLTDSRMHWSSLGTFVVPYTPSASSRWQQSRHVWEGHLDARIRCSVELSTKHQGKKPISLETSGRI